jgi:nucleotide-binding universal stress UspA family protein
MRPLRALVPQDGSTLAVSVLEPAASLIAALAAPATGTLHLVWVVNPVASESDAHQLKHAANKEQILDEAKQNLSAIVQQLHERLAAVGENLKLTITWSVALGTDVASTIVKLAENGEDTEGASVFGVCDVIAMATHGQSGMKRWTIGSVTQRVLNATRLPLLIVRPQDIVDKSHFIWDETTITLLLEWS